MKDLNDDWLSWPPESLEGFFSDDMPKEQAEMHVTINNNCKENSNVIKSPIFF